MRALIAVAVLAGCTENTAIHVHVTEAYTSVALHDADCSCPGMSLGCTTWSDVGPFPERCSCASSCTDALIVASLGDRVVSMIGAASWLGDLRGWALYMRGCGGEFEYVLPTELPVVPTISAASDRYASFEAPGATRVEVSTAGGFYGTTCRLEGSATSTELDGGGLPITVRSVIELPTISTTIGVLHPSVASQALSSPPPL